jgi:hypothetical protein
MYATHGILLSPSLVLILHNELPVCHLEPGGLHDNCATLRENISTLMVTRSQLDAYRGDFGVVVTGHEVTA